MVTILINAAAAAVAAAAASAAAVAAVRPPVPPRPPVVGSTSALLPCRRCTAYVSGACIVLASLLPEPASCVHVEFFDCALRKRLASDFSASDVSQTWTGRTFHPSTPRLRTAIASMHSSPNELIFKDMLTCHFEFFAVGVLCLGLGWGWGTGVGRHPIDRHTWILQATPHSAKPGVKLASRTVAEQSGRS